MGQVVWAKGNFETDTPKQVNAEVTEEVVHDSDAIAILPFGPYAPIGGMEPGLTSEAGKHASAGAPNLPKPTADYGPDVIVISPGDKETYQTRTTLPEKVNADVMHIIVINPIVNFNDQHRLASHKASAQRDNNNLPVEKSKDAVPYQENGVGTIAV
jgi:hypothetical protein